jgi:hypothetical protein
MMDLIARVTLEVVGMADESSDLSETKATPNAEVVTTKVNVAFPFSQIKVQEPSDELVELATLVRELADVLADIAPESKAPDLATRARALATRLK